MTRTQGGEYALRQARIYHAHIDCSVGEKIPEGARVTAAEAMHGRSLCQVCALMDGPKKGFFTAGGESHVG